MDTHSQLLQGLQEEIRGGEGSQTAGRRTAEDQAEVPGMRELFYLPEYAGALSELLQQLSETASGSHERKIQQEGETTVTHPAVSVSHSNFPHE